MAERDLHRIEDRLRERADSLSRGRALRPPPSALDVATVITALAEPAPARAFASATCGDCGAVITADRLAAVPDASRCMACQRAFESRAGG